ncbi:MAG TPA: plastocyanin/azurin family copper-binding protein [Chloroflexota bacterium]|jgi:plastocyanin
MSPHHLLAALRAPRLIARRRPTRARLRTPLALACGAALVALLATPLAYNPSAPTADGRALAAPAASNQMVQVGPGTAFNPQTVNVNVGETVTWTWVTPALSSHSTTSGTCSGFVCTPDHMWDSGIRTAGPNTQDFAFTFNTPGTFSYYCQVHGSAMTGQVVVSVAGPTATPTQTPAGVATATPTATVGGPTATPTQTPAGVATATAAPAACAPRPRVAVTAAGSGSGRLQATITVASNPGATPNRLVGVQFTSATGAIIQDSGGATIVPPFSPPLPPGATSYGFFIRPRTAGQAATVFLTATDNCGSWPTFVGGGPNGFPPAPPPAAPAAPAVQTAPDPAGAAASVPPAAVAPPFAAHPAVAPAAAAPAAIAPAAVAPAAMAPFAVAPAAALPAAQPPAPANALGALAAPASAPGALAPAGPPAAPAAPAVVPAAPAAPAPAGRVPGPLPGVVVPPPQAPPLVPPPAAYPLLPAFTAPWGPPALPPPAPTWFWPLPEAPEE